MARVGILGFIAVIVLVLAFHGSVAVIRPISDAHRSAALELFAPIDGSYASLEEAYKALRTFQILGLEKGTDVSETTCKLVVGKLMSSESSSEDLFHALKVNSILKCQIDSKPIEGMISKLKDAVKNAGSLLDYHHSVESLLQIKNLGHDITISDADGVFHSLKTLSQSDGRWRYESASAQSSSYAAGIALETLAGVISLASSDLDQSMIGIVKKDILKLFDSIRSYNDGTLYFDEKYIDGNEYKSPLIVSASVLRGTMAFSQVVSEKLSIPGDKIVGLAKFFLSIGIPGGSNDLFNQLDSLSLLENNRISIPLILSLPATVLSLTTKDQLKAEATTVFGSAVSPLTVNLVKVFTSGTENSPVLENQVLQFDQENNIHYLDIVPLKLDAGKYTMVFEISLEDPELANTYSTGGQTITSALLTGTISIDKAEIAILNSDNGGEESVQNFNIIFINGFTNIEPRMP